jgi:hypothetical protein
MFAGGDFVFGGGLGFDYRMSSSKDSLSRRLFGGGGLPPGNNLGSGFSCARLSGV